MAASTVAAVGVRCTSIMAMAWSALATAGVGGRPSARARAPASRWRPSSDRAFTQYQPSAPASRNAVSGSGAAVARSSTARRLS